jgi:hypothetical protein
MDDWMDGWMDVWMDGWMDGVSRFSGDAMTLVTHMIDGR